MKALSDAEAADRLARASTALGDEPGASVQAETALAAARKALTMLMLGLEQAGDPEPQAPHPPPPAP